MAHKILIIDDDKINVSLIKFGLAEQRYDVSFAYDGIEGLECVRTSCPDLIILDVHMPNMDGYEFMRELKMLEEGSHISVLMVTANDNMEDVFKLEGVRGYFVKPVDIKLLLTTIIECLGPNPI